MTSGITAEDIVRLFEEDARARKRLAELLVSEPDIRLAIINAVLRDVATKDDIEELRREMDALGREVKDDIEMLREEVRREINALRREVKEDIERLREEVMGEIRELRGRLWWVVATVILGWLIVIIEQLMLKLWG